VKLSAAAVVVAASAMAVGAIAAVASCIPDLTFLTPTEAGAAGLCGNGIIDLDAGEQCDPGKVMGDAAVAGCNVRCRMDCPNGFTWAKNNHCYQRLLFPLMAFEPPTQSGAGRGGDLGSAFFSLAASNACTGESHVVTFASEEEFQQVVQSTDGGSFWVGLHTAPDRFNPVHGFEPGWKPTCKGCYAHTPTPGEALSDYPGVSVDGGSNACVVASSNPNGATAWQQYPCSPVAPRRAFDVICESEPVGRLSTPCEAGECFELVWTYGKKRYVYRATPAGPDAARQACETIGGRLVVLRERDEREQLWVALSQVTPPPHQVWIGLSQVDAGGGFAAPPPDWIWEDGILAPANGGGVYPSEWAIGQPNPLAIPPLTATRAFLQQQTLLGVDDTLAHNDQSLVSPTMNAAITFPYVCEFVTSSSGSAAADQ
jgi:hypothetical protein